jgi:phosphatidylethanolamine/phosphatidyl-N-methylethanolamine N-methyltransferase
MSWFFLQEFFSNWRMTGAIAPSSARLARKMVDHAQVKDAKCILELGPGTGPFTEAIHNCMPEDARYLGLELNTVFVDRLRQRFPTMQFEAKAVQEYDFDQFLQPGEMFDTVVSGLPWTAFPTDLQISILDHALTRLKPGGHLATFAYAGFHLLPTGRHFRELLESRVNLLGRSDIVWLNVLPAFIYQTKKN